MTTTTAPWRSGALTLTTLALTAGLAGYAPAQAAAPTTSAPAPECQSGAVDGAADLDLLEGDAADAALSTVLDGLADGSLVVDADPASLDRDAAKVYAVTSDDTAATSVTIPLAGDYSRTSNLTVVLDPEGRVSGYSETQVSRSAQDTFRLTSFVDGAQVRDEVTDRAFVTDAEIARLDAAAAAADAGGVSTLNTAGCVASVLGVSGVTAYLIVGACTGACAVPGVGTAVCVACIGAYATVGGASITAVAACFR